MILGIAIVVVLVLLAVALLPTRKPGAELKQALAPASLFQPEPVRSTTLREQQVQEEASAIAAEFHRRADEVWLNELRGKAAELLAPKPSTEKA